MSLSTDMIMIEDKQRRAALERAMRDPQSPLTPQEYTDLITSINELDRVCVRQRAALELEQDYLVGPAGCGDPDALARWVRARAALLGLDAAQELLAQMRRKVTRLHESWSPESQARRDALIALERQYDALRLELQNLSGALRTFQVPPAAKVQRLEDA